MLLNRAPISKAAFTADYELGVSYYGHEDASDEKITAIETDGRFYRITRQDKSVATYDLGYNFIAVNKLENRPSRE